MSFDYREVLTRAWQIIWKHKILWIFGIFAGCSRGGGGSGGGGGGGGGGSGGEGYSTGPEFNHQIEQFFDQAGQWIQQNWWVIVVLVIAVLVLVLISIFLGTIGRIGLIRGTFQADGGAEKLLFGILFRESFPYFWRVFGLSLIIGLIFFALFIPIVLFGVLTAGIGFLCLLPLICILVPVSWAIMTILEQANAAIVIDNLGMMEGVRRGWDICKSNVGTIIIMALILWIGSAILGLVIALPIIAIVFLAFLGLAATQGDIGTPLWIAGICFVVYLPIVIVLGGILTAYVQSAWALTYIRLSKTAGIEPAPSPSNA
jgi:membrane-anchored glycerophosphoryl diester phosphodiesterase (GDPDase)